MQMVNGEAFEMRFLLLRQADACSLHVVVSTGRHMRSQLFPFPSLYRLQGGSWLAPEPLLNHPYTHSNKIYRHVSTPSGTNFANKLFNDALHTYYMSALRRRGTTS